ncbi:hypothetical protein ACRAWD_25620 [Caulobacter segnis]
MRLGRGHLGDREGQAQVHHRDDHGGDEHAAPAAGPHPQVPARELARDHRSDPQRPQREHPRIALEPAFLEIAVLDLLVADAAAHWFAHDRPSAMAMDAKGAPRVRRETSPGRNVRSPAPTAGHYF